ncbi:MAG: S26 family signal peptidase [Phycisphaerae bacterium]
MNGHDGIATATHDAVPPAHEGPRETIESIVIALILAFVFRAFIVEAFVIPTGSMAPTLYGAHGTIVCEDCGTEFAYGLRDLDDVRRSMSVGPTARAICPNCNHPNSRLLINDTYRNPETGDRILVLKWPFDVGGEILGPRRWDVVVFKDPADGETNFIKRLIGLPNEVLMIIDGDVYTAPTSELSAETVAALDEIRHEKYLLRTGQKKGNLAPVPMSVREELDRKARIVGKTPEAQEALWSVVYDHDYPPQTLEQGQPFWRADLGEESGWDTSGRRIHFEDRGQDDDFIELAGKLIRATCAYNIRARSQPPLVSDQRIRFVLTPLTDEAVLKIRLTKGRQAFWATVMMDGRVTLTESASGPGKTAKLDLTTRLPPFVRGKPVEISFENVDYRLAVRVGGKEVLASSSNPDDVAYYGPDIRWLRELARPWPATWPRIYATGGLLELAHLRVDRDVYYYLDRHGGRALTLPWAPRDGWASPLSPILLRSEEYFMLGDNTAASKDSRLWDQVDPRFASRGEAFQLGTVPRDQLIGKAFFVYWPAPNRVSWLKWLPLLKGAVIPDVGRMRWIR